MTKTDQPDEATATKIIERIWDVWYGEHRGVMTSDQFAATLEIAKRQIADGVQEGYKKADAEMERVKACEHIAEGDMDGNDWRVLRNICPSTAAVAALRDKYEALLMREIVLVRLKDKGVGRVLEGKAGMTFVLDKFCGVGDRCAAVRDYRYPGDSRPYQIWVIGEGGYEIMQRNDVEGG